MSQVCKMTKNYAFLLSHSQGIFVILHTCDIVVGQCHMTLTPQCHQSATPNATKVLPQCHQCPVGMSNELGFYL